MSTTNWRTINIDLLEPESPANFDISSLTPAVAPISAAEVQTLSGQIKQLLRGGDTEGALRGALENAPYGGDAGAKVSNSSAFALETLLRISKFQPQTVPWNSGWWRHEGTLGNRELT